MLKIENISVSHGRDPCLSDVSLELGKGKTLAVVGESGAGKSTLIAAILGLIKLQQGKISWDKEPVDRIRPSLVMQEPKSAFNPIYSLRQSVDEPFLARRETLPLDRLNELCKGLDLPIDLLDRRPNEVSVGQAQRVGILRAVINEPQLILFDEPLSALDAMTQKHTAKLIAHLQHKEGFSALIVTHDLGYAAAFADDIAVLREGRIEEVKPAKDFVAKPDTEYGSELLEAAFALGALERSGVVNQQDQTV